MVRLFRHMPGMACGKVMKLGVFRFFRQIPAHRFGQERADYHAERTGEESGKLRRDERIVGPENKNGETHRQSAENRRQRHLRGGAFPVNARKQRDEGLHQRDLVGVFGHLEMAKSLVLCTQVAA
jgi:hypothetical protein